MANFHKVADTRSCEDITFLKRVSCLPIYGPVPYTVRKMCLVAFGNVRSSDHHRILLAQFLGLLQTVLKTV